MARLGLSRVEMSGRRVKVGKGDEDDVDGVDSTAPSSAKAAAASSPKLILDFPW